MGIEPDFGISIHPMEFPIDKLGMQNVSVELYNLHENKKYEHQIILRLCNMDNLSLPPGISNIYDPLNPLDHPLANKDKVNTNLNIRVDKIAASKEYPLRILAIGDDGKQRSCPFYLVVPVIEEVN